MCRNKVTVAAATRTKNQNMKIVNTYNCHTT